MDEDYGGNNDVIVIPLKNYQDDEGIVPYVLFCINSRSGITALTVISLRLHPPC